MSSRDAQCGMVLLNVLWTIALCSVLAMATSTTFRSLAGIVAIDRDRVQADALLSAGLEVGAGIAAATKDAPLTARVTTLTLPTGSVRVTVSDEAGRIDIGKAPVEMLASLLRYGGAEDSDADIMAKKIVALRDADRPVRAKDAGARQAPGAKPDEREAVESAPPFTDIRQLAAVPGMRPEWMSAILPLITVYGSEAVNPLTAPAAVIRALPYFEEARLASFLDMRSAPLADGERIAFLLGRTQQYLKVQQKQVISVDIVASTTDRYSASARSFIVLLPGDKQPYRVLAWNPVTLRFQRDAIALRSDSDGD
jgi:general secretion pathway protein K